MSETGKKIGKGLAWGFGSLIGATVATAAGWIIYSKRFVNHNFKVTGALESDRQDFLSKRAGRLSYYVDKTKKGVPLVLLHSINAASSGFEMRPLFDHYCQTRPVYVLDLPGFGFSERSDRLYNPQLYQDAIAEFLKDVVGEAADVVALSLSSEFAALTAAHHPELIRSLAMISPTGFNLPRTGRVVEHSRKRGAQNNLYAGLAVALWNRPLFDLITCRPSIQLFLNKSFEGLVPTSFVDYAYHTAHQPGAQFAPTYFLSGKLFTLAVRETVYSVVEQPVIVLYDRDSYTNFEMLPGLLREKDNWQATRITPTKGLPHWEQPEKTTQALDQFWSNL